MARQRKAKTKDPAPYTLQHPDRGPVVDGKTLIDIARERQLFDSPRVTELPSSDDDEDPDDEQEPPTISPTAERVLESALWTVSLAMLHFTFDVLVQHQYGTDINWRQITERTVAAWASTFSLHFYPVSHISSVTSTVSSLTIAVFLFLFYPLHPHESNPNFIPLLPTKYQSTARQVIFFTMSVASGCYLIYVTNSYGYLHTMKRAPPLGCFWLWAVIELDLIWATTSLVCAAAYIYINGYSIK